MKIASKIFGTPSTKAVKRYQSIVSKINAFEPAIQTLSAEGLKNKTQEFKDRLQKGETLDAILPEAFALVREASKRLSGERHYDVQLMGGIALHEGNIGEMRTGEGKTLVATLPAYLNALTGEGVHVVTVNDYLARRDAVWVGQIYASLGLSVGVINTDGSYIYDSAAVVSDTSENEENLDAVRDELGSFKVVHEFLRPASRTDAYNADITYGTNNEYGFDHLRDNIEYDIRNLRQRGYSYAIVDEVDSILIDEARTPLIISAPSADSENLYATMAGVARELKEGEHFEVDEKLRAISMLPEGIEKAEKLLGIENIYTDKGIKYVHHLETAVRAKALFYKDKQYVVRDGQIIIVDEFTGRMQPGRRWSEGLHQAIEAKEGVAVERESRTYASITFQNYFRMYKKLSGMTGTAETSAEEFQTVYNLETIVIPTHRPIQRIDHNDLIYKNEDAKFKAVAKKVRELHEKGQPVLIGTVSIEKNERLSEYLKREGIPQEILNAKNHEREGEIIAQAGQKGRVTIATNMAGRGVDIKLGGNPAPKEDYEEVKSNGGLFVLGTERHEARRIDNQLRGRSGRQGDPGETQFYVSLEDDLMRIFAGDRIKGIMERLDMPEDMPIQAGMISRSLETAQKRIEGFNFDSRKQVLAYDNVLNVQRQSIYAKRNHALKGDVAEISALLDEIVLGDEEATKVLAERRATMGDERFFFEVRRLIMQSIDLLWIDHLETMDYLRGSVNLRAYGQRDPLIEYRKEGLRMFRALEAEVDAQIRSRLPALGGSVAADVAKVQQMQQHAIIAGGSETAAAGAAIPTASNAEKIGRNDIVKISNGTETREMKYKKAESLIQNEGWSLVQ